MMKEINSSNIIKASKELGDFILKLKKKHSLFPAEISFLMGIHYVEFSKNMALYSDEDIKFFLDKYLEVINSSSKKETK